MHLPMPKRTHISSILTAGAALCSLVGCASVPPGGYTQAPVARTALEEFPQVARNCGLPEALLSQFTDEGRSLRLLLPAALYARRDEAPVAGRIACIIHWGNERGLRLVVMGLSS